MSTRTFHTTSEEETLALGRLLAGDLPRRAVILLIGNLGAGKTTLAKGIIDGLDAAAPDDVSSPTFTLIHEYGAAPGFKVFHIDLYRLDHAAQVASLGLDEILDRDAVVLLEWAERFPELLPDDRVEIRLTVEGEEGRRIEIRKPGSNN
ncbi:MAG TPA: tRNA (adenosine(37)-N6)-threonylcarbamoyltransferase complex ATPase subunit type 1 TsaE [Bryobacteraceae bacterium]|nr:tRNA (adenosine(37)-N6)-threonylcarbamoyltransferase complex ATPase subunit type 1 TsaE [Bryobacteraceae bacterium]